MSESKGNGVLLSKVHHMKSSDDWKRWHSDIDAWLVDNDYDLDEPEKPVEPAGPATRGAAAAHPAREAYDAAINTYDKEIATWKRKQLKGVNAIKTTLPSTRGKNALDGVTTIDGAMEALRAAFKPQAKAVLGEVKKRWDDLSLAGCTDVNDYTTKFNDIYDELVELKFIENHAALNIRFLERLGPAFFLWRDNFETNDDITTYSLSEMQNLARDAENRLKSNAAMLARHTIAPATGGRNHYGKRERDDYDSGMWCEDCQSAAHNEDNCWKKHPEKEAVWRATNPEKAAQIDARKVLREAKKARRGRGGYRGGRGGRGNFAGHASTNTTPPAAATSAAPQSTPKGANGDF